MIKHNVKQKIIIEKKTKLGEKNQKQRNTTKHIDRQQLKLNNWK